MASHGPLLDTTAPGTYRRGATKLMAPLTAAPTPAPSPAVATYLARERPRVVAGTKRLAVRTMSGGTLREAVDGPVHAEAASSSAHSVLPATAKMTNLSGRAMGGWTAVGCDVGWCNAGDVVNVRQCHGCGGSRRICTGRGPPTMSSSSHLKWRSPSPWPPDYTLGRARQGLTTGVGD